MTKKIMVGLLWLAMLLSSGPRVGAQEAEDPDLERAQQIAAKVIEEVQAEQGALPALQRPGAAGSRQ